MASKKRATPAKKDKAKQSRRATLKQLIARTETVADKVAVLLGELRRLDQQGFVITDLSSGKPTKQNP